jgi:hypothetical protein
MQELATTGSKAQMDYIHLSSRKRTPDLGLPWQCPYVWIQAVEAVSGLVHMLIFTSHYNCDALGANHLATMPTSSFACRPPFQKAGNTITAITNFCMPVIPRAACSSGITSSRPADSKGE